MIDLLETFLAVHRHGNFSRAAGALDVAVSSVTRKVSALETTLGVVLFNRSTRELVLTDAGARLVPRALNIVADVAEAVADVSSEGAEPRGVLTVTAPSPFGRRHVAPAVAAFLKAHPLLEVELDLTDAMVDLVHERVDVAIRIGVLPASDLIATTLARQRRVLCASPAYFEHHGRPASHAQLTEHRCLTLRTRPGRAGWWQFPGFNQGKALDVSGSFRSDDSDALLQAAIAGLGIGHLATWLVHDEIAAGRLEQVLADPPHHIHSANSAGIYAIRVKGRTQTKAGLFIRFLQDYFGVADGKPPHWDRLDS